MKLVELKEYLIDLLSDTQYHIYFGTLSKYNTIRNFNDRQIIIEPFRNISLDNSDSCHFDFTLNLWIGETRPRDTNFSDTDGADLQFQDYLRDEANAIYDLIQNSDRLLILNKKQNVTSNYYEADQGKTSNMQSFINFSLDIRAY